MKVLLHGDIFFTVCQFLHLDEWVYCCWLNKAHLQLQYSLRIFIPRLVKHRLNQLLYQAFAYQLPTFYDLLQKYQGKISGSIILSVLIDGFKAGDIDCFLIHRYGFTSLHRFLYKLSTGEDSIEGAFSQRNGNFSPGNKLLHSSDDPVQLMLVQYGENNNLVTRRTAHKISSIHTYDVESTKFQVVNIESTIAQPFEMADYIYSKFDFRCCTSHFDGSKLVLNSLVDVLHRKLVTGTDFARRASLFNTFQIDGHKSRVLRYINRGFTIAQQISTAKLYEPTEIPYGTRLEAFEEIWKAHQLEVEIYSYRFNNGKRKTPEEENEQEKESRRLKAQSQKAITWDQFELELTKLEQKTNEQSHINFLQKLDAKKRKFADPRFV
jgi:hypothetical protein